MNLALPLESLEKLESYKEFLQKWNKIHNLSGARDSKEIL